MPSGTVMTAGPVRTVGGAITIAIIAPPAGAGVGMLTRSVMVLPSVTRAAAGVSRSPAKTRSAESRGSILELSKLKASGPVTDASISPTDGKGSARYIWSSTRRPSSTENSPKPRSLSTTVTVSTRTRTPVSCIARAPPVAISAGSTSTGAGTVPPAIVTIVVGVASWSPPPNSATIALTMSTRSPRPMSAGVLPVNTKIPLKSTPAKSADVGSCWIQYPLLATPVTMRPERDTAVPRGIVRSLISYTVLGQAAAPGFGASGQGSQTSPLPSPSMSA